MCLLRYVELQRETRDLDFLIKDLNSSNEEVEKYLSEILQVSLDDGFSLKNSYHSLFKEIIVGPENEMGMRSVTYVLRGDDDDISSESANIGGYGGDFDCDGSEERKVCYSGGMVEVAGIEPASRNISSKRTTCVV